MKTIQNDQNVIAFLDAIDNEIKRTDAYELLKIMQNITNKEPKMWGDTIIGFGSYHYKYDSGREGDTLRVGFSPRKNALTLYVLNTAIQEDLLQQLGKHKRGKSCLYIKKLADVDLKILKKIIKTSFQYMAQKYPE